MDTTTVIGVVGAGTMGAGIAQVTAQSGFQVMLLDAEKRFVNRGMERISVDLSKGVDKGRLSTAEREATLQRLQPGTDFGLLKDCQIVVEAVPETLEIKVPVLNSIANIVASDCIIASNTSSLSISRLAESITNPERVIGMHFFNPVPRMALVEIVAGEQTSKETVATVHALAQSLGKTAVQSRDRAGFIVNRVLIPMINEAALALQEGVATADDIDTAMKLGAAHPMGPLALADLIGLDVVLDIMKVLERELGGKYAPAAILDEKVRGGELGRKTGIGFFSYDGDAK